MREEGGEIYINLPGEGKSTEKVSRSAAKRAMEVEAEKRAPKSPIKKITHYKGPVIPK